MNHKTEDGFTRSKLELEELKKLWPDMYKDLDGYMFACPPGWWHIIRDLSEKIEKVSPGQVQVVQIKEKFGGLRFYIKGTTSKSSESVTIQELIQKAEAEAWHTCETCGTYGEQQPGGWIAVLCKDCYETRKNPQE